MTIEASKKLLENSKKDFAMWSKDISQLQRVGVLYTSWYPEVMEGLKESALNLFAALDISPAKVDQISVSGSWELPLLAKTYIEKKKPDLLVVLGCVVKGQTPHFDILCHAVTSELMSLQTATQTPLGFGVLTVNNLDQAQARLDKGAEAAEAALRSWIQLRKLL